MTIRKNMTFFCLTLVCVTALLIGMASCTRGVVSPAAATATAAQVQHERMWNEWVEAQP